MAARRSYAIFQDVCRLFPSANPGFSPSTRDWRDGLGWQNWRFDAGTPLGARERKALRARTDSDRAQRESAIARRHAETSARAARIWAASLPAADDHAYLRFKGIQAHGLRVFKGALVVPLRDATGHLCSLQFIGAGGAKRFLKGGRVAGCFCLVGGVSDTVCVAEGFATAASLHAATGHAVAVAFSAGNLAAAAEALRARHSGVRLIVCADDDGATPGNPGLTRARDTARATGALLAVPVTGDDRPPELSDFNDLHRLFGLQAVRDAVAAARPVGREELPARTPPAIGSALREWSDPEPLTEPLEAHPYPVQALPTRLRDAVRDVQAFVQAPAALVSCSALAALSLAAQGLVNVRRDAQLVGPVSVYLLAVADSGERKTTCDAMFCPALSEWETERRRDMAAEIAHGEAALAVFEAKKAGILDAIKLKRRRGENTGNVEHDLRELVREVPAPVKVPRLLYADATPEALAHSLATGWPSGGVLSAETGAVFGAHGMGQETILRNLALLNVLWDGGEMAVDRRSKPSFRLRARRLSFGLMVQPEAFRGFLERAGTLPRGTGFLARFLIAWPESTQGSRPYREAPAVLPGVERFNQRIRELLDGPLVTDEQGCLTPTVLDLAPEARRAWIDFHDCVEEELGTRGAFRDIRDVAAKAAENVARLAALFHVLEHGPAGRVGAEAVAAAGALVSWHLNEARRLLADLDIPRDLDAAIRLDRWLRAEATAAGTGRVPTRRLFQYGPGAVRDSLAFKAAMAILSERGRARLEEDGRRRYVAINPALLDTGE